MNHFSRPAVALVFLCPLIGCGNQEQVPIPEPVPLPVPETLVKKEIPTPPRRNPKIPIDVSYSISSDSDEGPARRAVDVNLNRKVAPEILREIALEVKAREEHPHKRTIIYYYLPVVFPELAGEPWASTHFNPDLNVKIIGFSKQEEETMRSMRLDHKGKRIGAWLQDNQYKTLDLIYDEDGTIKIAEFRSPTERSDSEMIEMTSPFGRRFRKVKGSNLYDVDINGNLRISNAEGKIFSAAKPLK